MEDKDSKVLKPKVYLIIDKNNKVVAYTSVNIPKPELIREIDDKELFDEMKKHGAYAIADVDVNYIVGLGLTGSIDA